MNDNTTDYNLPDLEKVRKRERIRRDVALEMLRLEMAYRRAAEARKHEAIRRRTTGIYNSRRDS